MALVVRWSDRRRLAELEQRAAYDDLTGLLNRGGFLRSAECALEQAAARDLQVTVVMLDLVGFADLNDSLGHDSGDRLLREVAARLRAGFGEDHLVARLGGDEFAVLVVGSARWLAQGGVPALLDALSQPLALGSGVHEICASVGLATVEPGHGAAAVLQQTDMALHEAKRQGRGSVVCYQPELGLRLAERLELVDALRAAIAAKQLRLVYQPVLDLVTEQIMGVEALVRWSRDGVEVPPDVFIPAAEESGLIVELGTLVVELVVADAPKLWPVMGPSLNVAVNVSPQQLRSRGFVEMVEQAVTAVAPLGLVMEITERDFVDDDPAGLAAMAHLNRAGVPFAIDDFGIGYSSLGYLQHLPVRILKIDKSFARDIDTSDRACNLLRSMALLGEAVGLDVVVEGIERPTQVAHLLEHVGEVYGQGYLMHRPMPLADLVSVLAANRRTALTSGRC